MFGKKYEKNGDRDRMRTRGVNVGLMRELCDREEVEDRAETVKDEL